MGRRIVFTVINDLRYDQRMHRICTTLVQEGYQVLLVGRELKTSVELPHFAFETKRIRCLYNKGKLFYLEYNIRLFFFLLFKKADIYGAVDLDTILPNLAVARLKGRKLTYDAHEYFTEVPEVTDRKFTKAIWKRVERFAVPKVDAAYTVSSSLAQIFSKEYGKEVEVIRNMPLIKEYEPAEEKEKIILYQGALNKGRGLEALLQAAAELELRIIIAGEGDLSKELRLMAKELQLEKKVQFRGMLTPEELDKITPTAFLGYNILENLGLSYYHSLANKTFDYVQAEVPVLCSYFPEYAALSHEFEVFIFTEPEKEEIIKAVNNILNDKKRYQQLKDNCARAKEVWNWEREKQKLIAVYEQLK